jgi:hypothetical protein
MAQLQNQLFQQGRGGLSVGATGMLDQVVRLVWVLLLLRWKPTTTLWLSRMLSWRHRHKKLVSSNVAFGAGLFGTGANMLGQYQAGQVGALNPFTTYLGAGQTIEELGQAAFETWRGSWVVKRRLMVLMLVNRCCRVD